MAVNEDLSAYSTTAASNTPAGSDNVGPNLDNHLRDIKRNIRRVAANRAEETAGAIERIEGAFHTDLSATPTVTVNYDDGSDFIPVFEIDQSANTSYPYVGGETPPDSVKQFLTASTTATMRSRLGLGTVATVDTGTDSGDVPLNSAWNRSTQTDSYTVQSSDNHALIDVGGGSPAVTLPEGSTLFNGFIVAIKSNSGSAMTISRSGSDTIDGSTSITLSNQNDWVILQSDGSTTWSVVSRGSPPAAASQAQQEAGTATDVYTSPGRQQFHQSAAKAWVSFNGSSMATIASYNVSGLTDNGSGDYTVTWDTNFSSSAYVVVAAGEEIGSNSVPNASITQSSRANGSVGITTANGAGSIGDHAVHIAAFGDQ